MLNIRNARHTGRRFIPGVGPLGPGETCEVALDLALRLVGDGLELVPQ